MATKNTPVVEDDEVNFIDDDINMGDFTDGQFTDPMEMDLFAEPVKVGVKELVPPGIYRVKCVSVEGTTTGPTSKTPGAPMLKLRWEITVGKYRKKQLFQNASGFMLDAICVALGLGKPGEHIRPKRKDILGKPIIVDVNHRPYNGEDRENIKVVKPADDLAISASSEEYEEETEEDVFSDE